MGHGLFRNPRRIYEKQIHTIFRGKNGRINRIIEGHENDLKNPLFPY
jgi:hypothetical protein